MAQNEDIKARKNAFYILALCVVVGIATWWHLRPKPVPKDYARIICEDAYTTEQHHENEALKFVKVSLSPGCFSGFVGLPSTWGGYQVQMVSSQDNDWLARWYQGKLEPDTPMFANEVNTSKTEADPKLSKIMRLEGRGTVEFYCVTGCDASASKPAPPAKPTPPKPVDETPQPKPEPAKEIQETKVIPTTGEPADLRIEFHHCVEVAAPDIECVIYASNKTDNLEEMALHDGHATDDQGNRLQVRTSFTSGDHATFAPNVKTKIVARVSDKNMKVQTINFELNLRFGDRSYRKYFFNDVPVQK
jgi:hypothetical protein